MENKNIGLEWLRYWTEETEDYELRDYSGRCMYGKRCPGITASNAMRVYYTMMLDLVQEDPDVWDPTEVLESLGIPATDSMGLEVILYFPNCPWEDEENSPEE